MTLYHGTNTDFDVVDLSRGLTYKDFGKGFYLSESEEQAMQMANFKSQLLGGESVVTRFEFDEAVMHSETLRTKVFEDYSEQWADFVFANREGREVEQYDIVYGPIANDKVGLQIRKLKDGSIDKAEFLNRLKYMKGITYQYFFGTEASIKHLVKL